MPARLLGIFADPLEASLLCGGTLARYSASGIETALALAGEVEPRRALAAARALGVRHLFLLDFEAGELEHLPPEALSAVLADLARAVEAQVVVTTAPGIGPPGRAALSRATSSAFLSLREQPDGLRLRPLRLYQASLRERQVPSLLPLLAPLPGGPSSGGSPALSDADLTATIDVRAGVDAKLSALSALEDGRSPSLLARLDPATIGHEYFRRAYPEPWVSGILERDLLAGIADRRTPPPPAAGLAG